VLIEQSIAKQYGILPTAQSDLPYSEWAELVGGLMDDTPLGRVVQVRDEDDPDVIKRFGPWELRIRAEWQDFKAKKIMRETSPEDLRKQMAGLEQMLACVFGGGK
jgi:hypothetical protein